MNTMNFFTWIRDGVRQAVLLGVNDAVEDLGTPAGGDDIRHKLLDVIRTGARDDNQTPRLTGSTQRRKLGRSINQTHPAAAKAS